MRIIAIALMGLASLTFSQEYMETLNWGFQGGNLVANWSFENLTTEICQGDQPGTGGTVTHCRERNGRPRSGDYVMSVNARNEGNPATQPWAISQISKLIPVEPSTAYTFSVQMQVRWSEYISSSVPVVCWMRADRSFIGCGAGRPYRETFLYDLNIWTPYSFEFTTASDARYIYFHMVQSDNDGVTGQVGDFYWFDNLQIRKSSQPAGVVETRSYSDAGARPDHTIVNDGAKDVITKREYDAMGRLHREYLPVTQSASLWEGQFVVSALNLHKEIQVDYATLKDAIADLSARTQAWRKSDLPSTITLYIVVDAANQLASVGSGPFLIEPLKSADGVSIPVTLQGVIRHTAAYWALPRRPYVQESGHWSQGAFYGDIQKLLTHQYPGQTNLFSQMNYPEPGTSTTVGQSLPGSLYEDSRRRTTTGTALLSTATIPNSVENSGSANAEAPYSYTWDRDPQGKYTIEIRDQRGLVVKSAVSDAPNPTSENDWIVSQQSYDEWGRQTTTTSPRGLTSTSQYNGSGQVIQVTDPDRGMSEFLYDSQGRIRFTRSSEGRKGDWFVAIQYDHAGRVIGKGRVTMASTYFAQNYADNPEFPGVTHLNEGALYDGFESALFREATGSPISSLGFTPPLKNTQGRLAVAFNRNTFSSSSPAGSVAATLLVASFYSYDGEGRAVEVWKYIGVAPGGRRWHKIKYAYDPQGMLLSTTTFQDQTENQVVLKSYFHYDVQGRVTQVDDAAGQPLARYSDDALSRASKVRLPGGLTVDYTYDVQGKPLQITGSTPGRQLFQELIGYETRAHYLLFQKESPTPRFDGKISSIVRKFSNGAPNPVECWRYEYDDVGRMIDAWKYRPERGGDLNPDGSFSVPVWTEDRPTTSSGYTYDDDGSIVAMEDGAATYNYSYAGDSHKLNAVTPNLPGRTTSAGSFVYDQDGRLVRDIGSQKSFTYNYANRPVWLTMPGKTYHYFYDENGNRVATLDVRSGVVLGRTVYVYETGLKLLKEIVVREAGHPDQATDVVRYHEHGRGGLVAINYGSTTDRHVLLKDHQGNVMMAVAMDGGIAKEQGYLPYGTQEKRVVGSGDRLPSETFTGKEFEEATGLYYFGARWYDPQLGMWLTSDPAGQFFNPYSYGGDPVNYVDPNGEWIHLVVGAIIGAGVGAYTAYQQGYDLTDWQTYAYVGGGAAIGVGVAATGGAIAGAAGGGFAGAVAGGAAAGAGGSAANYTLTSGVGSGFDNFSGGGLWDATWKGGASGAVGGGVAGGLGHFGVNGAVSSFGSGFAGGATGAALNGAEGWDIVTAGLVGGGIGVGAYSAKWGYENYGGGLSGDKISLAEGGDGDVPRNPRGTIRGNDLLREADTDFRAYAKTNRWASTGESSANYQIKRAFWTGRLYAARTFQYQAPGGQTFTPLDSKAAFSFHSHPHGNYPSSQDYSAAGAHFFTNATTMYVVTPNGNTSFISPWSRNFYTIQF